MMARSLKAPSIGRIQMRKTNFSKSSLSACNARPVHTDGPKGEVLPLRGGPQRRGEPRRGKPHGCEPHRGVADLTAATVVEADLTGADLTGCRIYGVSAWDLKLEDSSRPYAMFKDYWKYEWVLPVYRYEDLNRCSQRSRRRSSPCGRKGESLTRTTAHHGGGADQASIANICAAKLLTRGEARRIAANSAKLPELLRGLRRLSEA
jgi:uncharacterized protein YjbI with pentapeptide repeats